MRIKPNYLFLCMALITLFACGNMNDQAAENQSASESAASEVNPPPPVDPQSTPEPTPDPKVEKTAPAKKNKTAKFSRHSIASLEFTVGDVPKWYDFYKKNTLPERRLAVYQSTSNAHQLLVLEYTVGHAQAKKRYNSPKMKAAVKNAGIKGYPEIGYLDVRRTESDLSGVSNLVMMRHQVRDFVIWEETFNQDADYRKEQRIELLALTSFAEDPNQLYLFFNVPSGKSKAAIYSESLQLSLAEQGFEKARTTVWQSL